MSESLGSAQRYGERVCEECMAGEHDICLRAHLKGKADEPCDCHVTGHRHDNRPGT